VRRAVPALFVFLVLTAVGCGSSSKPHSQATQAVRTETNRGGGAPSAPPTSRVMHRDIVDVVNSTFKYESNVLSFERKGSGPPDLQPEVVATRNSPSDPRYATAVVELKNAAGERQPGTSVLLMRGRHLLAQTGTRFMVACTDQTPRGVRDLACPNPWKVLRYPEPAVRLDETIRAAGPISDIHQVHWQSATLPGAACRATRPLHFTPTGPGQKYGEAWTRSVDDPWWLPVHVNVGVSSGGGIAYGDLDGDGADEAAVQVVCDNGGGTADGQLRISVVVVGVEGGALRPLGVISARQPLGGVGVHVPLVSVRAGDIGNGRITTREFWYGPSDGTCCSSGRASTAWVYSNGKLRPSHTTVRNPVRVAD
jgi:hypothetical protein